MILIIAWVIVVVSIRDQFMCPGIYIAIIYRDSLHQNEN